MPLVVIMLTEFRETEGQLSDVLLLEVGVCACMRAHNGYLFPLAAVAPNAGLASTALGEGATEVCIVTACCIILGGSHA